MARMLSIMYFKCVLEPTAVTNSHLIVKIKITTHRSGSPSLLIAARPTEEGETDLWRRQSLEAAARSKRRRLGKELQI
jgi:hypothetical protein